MPRIFVSYRRADTRKDAGRLNDRLVQAFGPENVFKDVDDIPPGTDFRDVITQAIRDTDVMLVVVGSRYVEGARLLQDGDFVRMEIENALAQEARGLKVIPVLVDGAQMPNVADLPPSLHELPYRNAVILRDDPDFNRDADRLIAQLQQLFPRTGPASRTRAQPGRATSPTRPTPTPIPARTRGGGWGRALGLVLGGMVLAFVGLVALGAYLEQAQTPSATPTVPPTTPQTTPAPTNASTSIAVVCPAVPPPRLVIGGRGQVLPGTGNRIREDPTTSAMVLTTIPGNRQFDVLDGPACADGYSWWQVRYGSTVGWTAEGSGVVYFLQPATVGEVAQAPTDTPPPSATTPPTATVTVTPGLSPTLSVVNPELFGTLVLVNPEAISTNPPFVLNDRALSLALLPTSTPLTLSNGQSVRFITGEIRGRSAPEATSRRDPTLQSTGGTLRGAVLSGTPVYADDTWWWQVRVSLSGTMITAWFRQQDLR